MKYLICSDIHGSKSACKKAIDFFYDFKCDKILILGDILYHGPRNDLPPGHDPKGVITLLNPLAEKILACRGNCDAEVDQMVLNFPCMADYVLIEDNGTPIFCTHGHVFAPLKMDGKVPEGCEKGAKKPLIKGPGIVFYGHTHISLLEKGLENLVLCNPGSLSLPKGGKEAGFAVYENHKIGLYNIEGKELKSLEF